MRGTVDPSAFLYEPEIERLARKTWKEAQQRRRDLVVQASREGNMENLDLNNGGNGNGNGNGNGDHQCSAAVRRTLGDYAFPNIDGCAMSIVWPAIQANNFEVKPTLLHLVQQEQFGGGPLEDPNSHITNFLQLCDTIKVNGASEDAISLRLSPFSLRDKAKSWLLTQSQGSITTWEDC